MDDDVIGLIFGVSFLVIAEEIFYAIYTWLRYGEAGKHSLCGTFDLMCSSYTEWVGVNNILFWFSTHSIAYIAILGIILTMLFYVFVELTR